MAYNNVNRNNKNDEHLLEVAIPGVPKCLHYSQADCQLNANQTNETSKISVGYQVIAPINKRYVTGWVINTAKRAEIEGQIEKNKKTTTNKKTLQACQISFLDELEQTKEVTLRSSTFKSIVEAYPAFHPSHLNLFRWMSEYYGANIAEVIDNAIPKRALNVPEKTAYISQEFSTILQGQPDLLDRLSRKAPSQHKILNYLLSNNQPVVISELAENYPSHRSALNTLATKGLVSFSELSAVEYVSRMLARGANSTACNLPTPCPPTPNKSQQDAINTICSAIDSKGFNPILLHGITGSGKTEIYIRAIEHTLSKGGNALLLVPEIALTPQLIDSFLQRLQVPIGLLHSQVGHSFRWAVWEQILKSNIRVAIGARSAIFAPFEKLDLIIVDEEHEHSYKQSEGMRYNGRDVAIMRAHLDSCPIVLGSATPSFESLFNAHKHKYTYIELPERATTRPLPSIEVINLTSIRRKLMPSENISPALFSAIEKTLENKQQVIIFYNRRGFSSFLQCSHCHEVVTCPNCSVTLTYHKGKAKCICHFCNLSIEPPKYCGYCRDSRTTAVEENLCNDTDEGNQISTKRTQAKKEVGTLIHRGAGTERVMQELKSLFPNANIVRLDRDTVTRKDAYREILGKMKSGEADILVGTQMIAKGHDIPGVTLVGIIDADVGLNIPDFRASEKTYQLITQAAGRAGRGSEHGHVIVQTREPHHPTIVAAVTGRFKAFAKYELKYRETLKYPPFGRLLRVVISSSDRLLAPKVSKEAVTYIKSLIPHINNANNQSNANQSDVNQSWLSIIGPAPAPYEKLRNQFRWHILVKAKSARTLSQLAALLRQWHANSKVSSKFKLVVDIDPVDMM